MSLLSIRDLEVRAAGRRIASLPSLDVSAGQCAALVGESGSGKTTALRAMLGLTDDLETTGSVLVDGHQITGASEKTLAGLRGSSVALIGQSPQASLNPTMRLGTLMRRALARHGTKGEAAKERAASAMGAVRLDEALLKRYPHQVSGGQAQRFAIALAVALGAKAILADEPTSALDTTVQKAVLDLLARLREERGLAVVLVSHDLAVVSGCADHVTVMRAGEVVEAGAARDVLTAPKSDYTRDLLAAVPVLRR
ncbi:hypothetical protein GCM10022221_31230 [Actinocorallia aurea]